MDPNDLTGTIQGAATTPAAVTGDLGSHQARPIQDLIAADRYLAAKASASQRHRGLRFTRLIPPGTVHRLGRQSFRDGF